MVAQLDPPLRQLTRLRSELSISTAQLTAGMFPDQPFLGIEFGTVARVCLPEWTRTGTVARPAAPEQSISVRKAALSLGNSPESTRRHVNLLLERGVFVATADGVALAPTEDNEALMRRYYLGVHDRFVQLIEDMHATCDLQLPVSRTPSFGPGDVIERAMDILLLPIDTFRPAGTTRMGFLLWGALTVVAVREVTYDPVLSRLYANSIPADEHRIGISLRALAAAMAVPYATAWRQIQALEEMSMVTRLGSDRWTVLTQNLLIGNVREIGTQPSALLLGKIRELALLGLDPARVAGMYKLGRPPLADLGLSQRNSPHPAAGRAR